MTNRPSCVHGPCLALRRAAPTLILAVAIAACGPPSSQSTPPDAPNSAAENISGRYDLSGVTIETGTGHQRKIAGTMVLKQRGDAYTASYEFETHLPGEDVPIEAHVIGVGEGTREGSKLVGTARTQLVVSSVPGVDPGFAFIPRGVTARIESESVALVGADGSIDVDIVSRAAQGASYVATRTHMSGARVDDLTPPVAASPVE